MVMCVYEIDLCVCGGYAALTVELDMERNMWCMVVWCPLFHVIRLQKLYYTITPQETIPT